MENYTYPGAYVPMFDAQAIRLDMQSPYGIGLQNQHVNITESGSFIKIELSLPGVRKEDLLLSIDNSKLSIVIVQKVHNTSNERFKGNDFQYYCVQRQIVLAEDIDAGFSTATYDNGLLRIQIPKTKLPVLNTPVALVVY